MELKQGYKQTDLGIFPTNWDITTMGKVGKTIIGLTYSPNDVNESGTLVLRSSNVQNNQLSFKDNVYVSMDIPKRVIVKEKDILICVRNGSKKLIGKCALINKETEGQAFGAFMSIYRSKFSEFIFYAFQSHLIQKQIDETMGATINQITNKNLDEFKIPLPPLPEQTAIATVLSDTDQLIQAIEKKIAKKRLIKQGAMQELLRPKEGWVERKLGEVITFSGGSQPPRDTFIYNLKEGYVRLLQIRDYKSDKYASFIPIKLANKFCSENDIMIGRYGPPIFQILRGKKGAYNVALMKAIPNDLIDAEYAWHFFNQEKLFHFVEKLSQRSSGQTGVDLVELRKYPISLPSLKSQIEIAAILSDMDSEIETLDKQLAKYKELKQGLMQNLLTGKIRLV